MHLLRTIPSPFKITTGIKIEDLEHNLTRKINDNHVTKFLIRQINDDYKRRKSSLGPKIILLQLMKKYNHCTRTVNKALLNVAKFKYLKAIINQISIHEEIKDRQNSGNACNHSVQTLSSFRFHNLYSSSYIIITKWTVHVASKTPFGNTHKLLVGKAEEKQPHGRPCRKAETTQLLRSRGCRM